MQFATAILLTLGLLGSPVGCLVKSCQIAVVTQDCCPSKLALTACPYDILSSAKAAPDQQVAVTAATTDTAELWLPTGTSDSIPVASVQADQRDLHLENRVLRR